MEEKDEKLKKPDEKKQAEEKGGRDPGDFLTELLDKLDGIGFRPVGVNTGAPAPEEPPQPKTDPLELVKKFSFKPREIRDYLDR